MNLELLALRWLRFERQCPIALRERSTRSWQCGNPDVLGVTKARYLIEVEIKRSLSDFKADAKKKCRINRHLFLDLAPRQFYYLIPSKLMDSVLPLLPPWAGLMTNGEPDYVGVLIKVRAPVNNESRKLSIKECVHLTQLVSNYTLAQEEAIHRILGRFTDANNLHPWNWYYQI